MIIVDIVLDESALLYSCRVKGHSGAGKQGNDIVCAAVSVLTRTIVRVLDGRKDISMRGSIPARGEFNLELEYKSEGREFLAATGTFLMEGLKSVSEEFPDNCTVNIQRRK